MRILRECHATMLRKSLLQWPGLLSNFLTLLWCTPILQDEGGISVAKQRLKPDPDLICWTQDHFPVGLTCLIGLLVWCLGVPILIFFRIWALKDRQSPDNNRKFGFFIQGYEPKFWWWDIIVKRLDVGVMKGLTYTSVVSDAKAKLLLFPIFSGFQLGLFTWFKPFHEAQGGILDVLEMCLLIVRFCLFSIVSIILIFNPPRTIAMVLAVLLVSLLGLTCAFFGLHVVAQFLRAAAADIDKEKPEKRPAGIKDTTGKASQSFVTEKPSPKKKKSMETSKSMGKSKSIKSVAQTAGRLGRGERHRKA
eukprot:Skav223082  [mRNA]  locus=scaffold419:250247:251663:+ [translate_table: standard]